MEDFKGIVSNVRVVIHRKVVGMIGFASVDICNKIRITSIGIWDDGEGIRLTYPTKGPKQIEVVHPIDREVHDEIIKKILMEIKGDI